MANVRGQVLIETEVGKAKSVAERLRAASLNGCSGLIVRVDMVTGPYDVIAEVQHEDLDLLGGVITETIQKIPGVQKTTTCLVARY